MAIVCNCPNRCEIHPKPKLVEVPVNSAVPEIEAADKLTLKTLEAESLKAQIEAQRQQQQLIMRVQQAHQQLEMFTAAMFDKAGVKQSEWQLDLTKLEFVKREQPKA